MWLINVWTLKLVEFIGDEDVPKYAILSHTWGKEEVSFQDITGTSDSYIHKEGFQKIDYTCREAKLDGLQWAWVDTCCIDKKSSAELSEAINSMFRYYERSVECYAYLADITEISIEQFKSSRWFTRGWTLQELIAPSKLQFFTSDWVLLGDKYQLSETISIITRINQNVLEGTEALQSMSVARRMSWAAERKTTRVEDMAYSLLGIFGVNMPLLYGEGMRAFTRLQEEILKVSNDQTLFAWGDWPNCSTHSLRHIMRSGKLQNFPIEGSQTLEGKVEYTCTIVRDYDPTQDPLQGLFARTPSDFSGAVALEPARGWSSNMQEPVVVTGGEVRIRLPVLTNDQTQLFSVIILGCSPSSDRFSLIGLLVKEWDNGVVGRLPCLLLLSQDPGIPSTLDLDSFRALTRWFHFKGQKAIHLGEKIFSLSFPRHWQPMLLAIYTSDSLANIEDPSESHYITIKQLHFGPVAELIYKFSLPPRRPYFLAIQLGLFRCDSDGRSTQEMLLRARVDGQIENLLGPKGGFTLHTVSTLEGKMRANVHENGNPILAWFKNQGDDLDENQPWQKEVNLWALGIGDSQTKFVITREAVTQAIDTICQWKLNFLTAQSFQY